MTPYENIYNAFLAQIQEDEWQEWNDWEREEDWFQLLSAAVSWFKFPRTSLKMEEEGLEGDLSNIEIQILVAYMKHTWLERVVLSWENLRPLYSERDFSPATMLDKFRQQVEHQLKIAKELEARYYRSVDGSPYSYSNLSGG